MLKLAPGASKPEFHAPLFAVDVCATESLLVHVTVPPTLTLIGFGEYAVVVSVVDPDTIDTGVPVVVGAVVDGDDDDPQPEATHNKRIRSA